MHVQALFCLGVTVFVIAIGTLEADSTNFVRVGCYRDLQLQPRPLPKLIHNYRLNNEINWLDLNTSVIDPCAKEARTRGYLYFGIQFYGECWSGPLTHLTFMKDGPSKSCVKGVGRGFTNMVYRIVGQERECENYQILDSKDRSASYNKSGSFLCDGFDEMNGNTDPVWYRFTKNAGIQMADGRIEIKHCKTLYGGWYNGRYPNITEGIVDRKVCFGPKCSFQENMKIRNCGLFYVYKLKPVNTCDMRYCGNGKPTPPITAEI